MRTTHAPKSAIAAVANHPLTHGDLFSGIGGFSLAAQRAGIKTLWHSEIDPYASAVLQKHWPDVPNLGDITKLDGRQVEPVDIITAGFPCQPVSVAGRRQGDQDDRWMWPDTIRIIREVRPRWVLLENVPGLLVRGLGDVLRDLAEGGFDAEWDVLGACAGGASMHRHRVWILAYPNDAGLQGPVWAGQPIPAWPEWAAPHREPLRSDRGHWPPGPRAITDIPRMVDGPTNRAHRLRGLGNAIVPQVAEYILRRIVAVDAEMGVPA